MHKATDKAMMYLMTQLYGHGGAIPDTIRQAFLAVDRLWPTWRPPQHNLENPPKVGDRLDRTINATVTATCPTCQANVSWSCDREDDFTTIQQDLQLFRQQGVCAH